MRTSMQLAGDMIALARLHAALDFVVETQQLISGIRETSPGTQPGVVRLGQLLGEANALLRRLLTRQENRHAGELSSERGSDAA